MTQSMLARHMLVIRRGFGMLTAALLLAGCSGLGKVPPASQRLDLGAPPPSSVKEPSAGRAMAVVLPPLTAAPMLEDVGVIWRVGPDGVPNRYATYEWAAAPASLVHERLVDMLSRQYAVLPQSVSGSELTLRVNLMQFEQIYAPDGSSNQGVVSAQAVLLRGTSVLAQYRITETVTAQADDAPAGARALRQATGQMADNIVNWINRTVPNQK